MSVSRKRALAGLLLLLLAFLALLGARCLSPKQHRERHPALDRLVADLRWEAPWYYRWLKRTRTLRFLPKRDLDALAEMGSAAASCQRDVEPLLHDEDETVAIVEVLLKY